MNITKIVFLKIQDPSGPIIREEKFKLLILLKDTRTDSFMSELDQTLKQTKNFYAVYTIPEQWKQGKASQSS